MSLSFQIQQINTTIMQNDAYGIVFNALQFSKISIYRVVCCKGVRKCLHYEMGVNPYWTSGDCCVEYWCEKTRKCMSR